jgi:DNA-damage-inducible protein D
LVIKNDIGIYRACGRSWQMSKLIAKEYKRFEDIKQIREDGTEFWSARELATALDYNKWENFYKVIKRAMIACENSGHSITDDFPEVRKIVEAGATKKPIQDYELSRYACYLIVKMEIQEKKLSHLGRHILQSRHTDRKWQTILTI